MTKTDTTPLTDNERQYLDLMGRPGPYRNPKWHDYDSMSSEMGITRQEVRSIEQRLVKKGYLARHVDGLFMTRTRKDVSQEKKG